jgi:hypothetical protein
MSDLKKAAVLLLAASPSVFLRNKIKASEIAHSSNPEKQNCNW